MAAVDFMQLLGPTRDQSGQHVESITTGSASELNYITRQIEASVDMTLDLIFADGTELDGWILKANSPRSWAIRRVKATSTFNGGTLLLIS